jgi:hypothetical protein
LETHVSQLTIKVRALEALLSSTSDTAARAQPVTSSEVVSLNVGGTKFDTTRDTLTKVPGSFFETLLSGRWIPSLDKDGCIFIDREGAVFGYILNYLRDYPRVTLNPYAISAEHVQLLSEDAKFYQLPTLTKVLETPLFGEGMITKSECDWLLCKLPIGRQNTPKLVFRQSAATHNDPLWKVLEGIKYETPWYDYPYISMWSTKCGWVIGYYASSSRFIPFTVRRPDGGMPTYSDSKGPAKFTLSDKGKQLTLRTSNPPYEQKTTYDVLDGTIWQVDPLSDPTHGQSANGGCTIS